MISDHQEFIHPCSIYGCKGEAFGPKGKDALCPKHQRIRDDADEDGQRKRKPQIGWFKNPEWE